MPLDLERIDFQRMPPRNDQPRQQNGRQNGAGNGITRQPAALTAAPAVPGGPLAPKPGVRPSSRGGKKDQGEDDDGKGKGKGATSLVCSKTVRCKQFHEGNPEFSSHSYHM